MLTGEEKEKWEAKAGSLERIVLNEREISDLEMIATGAFSPLTGFMCQADYLSVLEYSRLPRGLPWTIPITLAVGKREAERYRPGDDIALYDGLGNLLGILSLYEKWEFDKEKEARKVYGTTDEAHPGVKYLLGMGEVLLGGPIYLLNRPPAGPFERFRLDPIETRVLFQERGWQKVVAFQTRNPVHRAHEYIQKCALEMVDGLLLDPLVGATKAGDIPAEVRMRCYQVLLEKYYPKDRVVLSIFPAAMRYAGPREAVFHAIVRKNYGCTHFIVGRDHAGVGSYYGTYDAQRIFDTFSREEIDIIPMCFDHAFYCRRCGGMASTKTCPPEHEPERVILSGTKVRKMLARGELPPPEFTRPEVAEILLESMQHKEAGV